MIQPVAQAHASQRFGGLFFVRDAVKILRQHHILERREIRHQMKLLKHESHSLAAELRQFAAFQLRAIHSADPHASARRLVETTDPFGNRIEYLYERDSVAENGPHRWDQLRLKTIRYADYGSRDMTLRPDAGRYECGTLNTAGCFGLKAAIEFLLDVGIENIATAIDALAKQLETGVREKGYQVMVERTPQSGSGILSFRHPSVDCRVIVSALKRHRILAAPRQGWIRTSPHFYISPDDINQVLQTLHAA